MSAENPISPKVIASTTGAGVGAALSTLTLWLLGVVAWGAPSSAGKVADAIAAVPTPVSAVIVLAIPALLAALLSWSVTDPLRVTIAELRQVTQRLDPRDEPSRDDD